MSNEPAAFAQTLQIVQQRRTEKVMAQELGLSAMQLRPMELSTGNARLTRCIAGAGWAPFHFARNANSLAEPWRVHWLQQPRCAEFAAELPHLVPDLKPGNRFPALLQACGSLVLVYWIPESVAVSGDEVKRAARNEEHLLATAAYVQTLLLLATAADLGTFWSSGSLLRSSKVQAALKIPTEQQLAAAIFVDYTPQQADRPVDRVQGGLRGERSDWQQWCRILT